MSTEPRDLQYFGPVVAEPVAGILSFYASAETITRMDFYVPDNITGTGDLIFNIRINGVTQYAGAARPTIVNGTRTASLTGLSVVLADGDLVELDVDALPSVVPSVPWGWKVTTDDGTTVAGVAEQIVAATAKAVPVDADSFGIVDSEASNVLKEVTFTALKAFLATYFDARYVDAAPGTLDTLNELAAALADDPNFATTVTNALALKAPLDSPALTGTPTAPTAASGTNTTQIATTAFVQDAVVAGGGYTDEQAQDAVGGILADTAEIDFNYDDVAPAITASIVAASVGESKLNASVNASLDKADTALQAAAIGVTVQAYDALLDLVAALADPNADRLLFWDESVNAFAWLELGTNLSITGTVLDAATGSSYTDEQAQDAVGAIADASLVYNDAAPSLSRAALTGDVTAAEGSNATTIANDAVTNAKLADMAAGAIKARKTAGSGDPEDCTLSEVLDLIGSTAHGDLLYRASAGWARLPAGTSGQFLKTQGAAANPIWESVPGGGDLLAANNLSDVADTSAARTNLGLAIGTNVQAYDAALSALSNALNDLADPNADRILFWDDSAGTFKFLEAGTGLTITDTTIAASGGGGGGDVVKSGLGLAADDPGSIEGLTALTSAYTIPAASLAAGNIIKIEATMLKTGTTDAPRFGVRLGSTDLGITGGSTPYILGAATTPIFILETWITIGATDTQRTVTRLMRGDNPTLAVGNGTGAVDTDVNQDIVLTGYFNANPPTDTMQCLSWTVRIIAAV